MTVALYMTWLNLEIWGSNSQAWIPCFAWLWMWLMDKDCIQGYFHPVSFLPCTSSKYLNHLTFAKIVFSLSKTLKWIKIPVFSSPTDDMGKRSIIKMAMKISLYTVLCIYIASNIFWYFAWSQHLLFIFPNLSLFILPPVCDLFFYATFKVYQANSQIYSF